jgi:hypothetical protein
MLLPQVIRILCCVVLGAVGRCDRGTGRNSQFALWLAAQFLVLSKFEKLLLHLSLRPARSANRPVSWLYLRLPSLSGKKKKSMEFSEMCYFLVACYSSDVRNVAACVTIIFCTDLYCCIVGFHLILCSSTRCYRHMQLIQNNIYI